MPTPKKKAWTACSRYIRLRDALNYCRDRGIDLHQFIRPEDILGLCATCGAVKSWIYMDCGHWKGRGLGGGSGTYFDERNLSLQCKQCNGFKGGKPKEHEEHLRGKYGQEIIDELERKHQVPLDSRPLPMRAMEQFYKKRYKELLEVNYEAV